MLIARQLSWQWVLLASFAGFCGCGNPQAIEAALDTVRQINKTSQKSELDMAGHEDATADLIAFEPPYPTRENPFLYVAEGLAPSPQSSSGTITNVSVLGFVDVGQLRVILKLHNEAKSMAVGETLEGVEVLDIMPPNVRLKLGNLTWNASLFDQKTIQ